MTKDQVIAAIADLEIVCKKHGIALVGYSHAEMTRAEIYIIKAEETANLDKVVCNIDDGYWSVGAIA